MRPIVRFPVITLTALVGLSTITAAGSLAPPAGPVAPTHKTLTEVEPRTAINATNTPGDPSSVFRITQPGSYYLTGNVEVAFIEHGISIDLNTEGLVTIDLAGFSLIGREGTLNGIDVDGPFQPRVIVRNGFVTMFDGNGVDMTGSESATIEHVECSRNSGRGFVLGVGTLNHCKAQYNSLGGFKTGATSTLNHCEAITTGPIGFETDTDCRLTECTAKGCTNNGFDCDSDCVLTNCVATNNTGYGILTYPGCSFIGCNASNNGEAGFSANQSGTFIGCVAQNNTKWGFSAGGTSAFQSCTAMGNGFYGFSASFSQIAECLAVDNGLGGFGLGGITNISKCSALQNGGDGISGGGACVVVECSAMYNDGHGISLTLDGNIIRGNQCTGNGQGAAPGAGIHTNGVGHRIEDNLCKSNDIGIDVAGSRNVIVRNVCGTNTTNWAIAVNNSYGPIIDRSAAATPAVSGNSAAAALGSTDASANFTN